MTFTVVYDANVLYPNPLRDLLIRIAQSGTVQAKWTNAILDEMLAARQARIPVLVRAAVTLHYAIQPLSGLHRQRSRSCSRGVLRWFTGNPGLGLSSRGPGPFPDRAAQPGSTTGLTAGAPAPRGVLRQPERPRPSGTHARCPYPVPLWPGISGSGEVRLLAPARSAG